MRISYNWLKDLLPALQHAPEEAADILTLHSFETVIVGPLIDHLPADIALPDELVQAIAGDIILEADITPNRAPDCLSHLGLARELAALLDISVKESLLPDLPSKTPQSLDIAIADPALCRRYLGITLENLRSAPSPLWLQARLLAAGNKPLNNVVDITNYVMFEYGNPAHLFDRTRLPAEKIVIRGAEPGERITLLDNTEYMLEESDLVIAAGGTPAALAGIMGGKDSAVDTATTAGLLEVASFRAFTIQETARRHHLRTESSQRFSKGLDPGRAELAARRAAALLQELAGAKITGVQDIYPNPAAPRRVSFRPERVNELSGAPIADAAAAAAILTRLRCVVDRTKEPWRVRIPADRLDIEGEHDLVEEVIRVSGLENIPAAALTSPAPAPWPHHVYWREVTRDALVALGFTETYNSSFEPAAYAALLALDGKPHLSVANPPAPDLANLRVSLLPGLLANAVANRELLHRQAGRKESALFEIGHIYLPAGPADPGKKKNGRVPGVIEVEHLAGIIVREPLSLESIAAVLASTLHLDRLELTNALPPEAAARLKFRVPLIAFELNLTALLQRVEEEPTSPPSLQELQQPLVSAQPYQPIPKHPAAYRDLSLLVAPDVSIEQVQEIIERTGGQLVDDVDLFDIYDLAPDKKSLAFHIAYQAFDRTLTDDEVNNLHNTIVAALRQELDAQLRE